MQLQGQVGPNGPVGDGTIIPFRQGRYADVIVSELQGRFYEATYRSQLYSGGMTLTSISNATFSTGTLGATATPIIGLWNPATSPVNLAVHQATVTATLTALTATGLGGLMWCYSIGNAAISTGSAGINRKTLVAAGSYGKFYAGTALTGLTNNLAIGWNAAISGGPVYNVSEVATAAGFHTLSVAQVENFDGSIIVPPGGVLALLCTTNPPVAVSANSSILWAEVAI